MFPKLLTTLLTGALQAGGFIPGGSRVNVFEQLYWVFTILGTIVGVIVIGYMLYIAYKNRDDGAQVKEDQRPQLGELPTGGGKGRKLFLSFTLSAIVVISLIVWSYGTLLYVENAAADEEVGPDNEDVLDVTVVGFQFGWHYAYEGGNETLTVGEKSWSGVTIIGDDEDDVLRIPANQKVRLTVISSDVFHNFGIPGLRVKSDAIPGQATTTWVEADDAGETYEIKCYELCGSGHSYMTSDVQSMSEADFNDWYQNTTGENPPAGGA